MNDVALSMIDDDTTVVTIDGPTASGTSSMAEGLGIRLNWPALNTGHLYRGVALVAAWNTANIHESAAMEEIARGIRYEFDGGSVIAINDRPVTEDDLRSVTNTVAHISHNPSVRAPIRDVQHDFAREHKRIVVEGRDLGSVVFPDALAKFYLECDDEVRAHRISEKEGRRVTVAEMLERDRLDSEREESPMIIPNGALVIDTTFKIKPEVVDFGYEYLMAVPTIRTRILRP